MKTTLMKGIAAIVVAGGSLMIGTGEAAADSLHVSVSGHHGSVSYGHHGRGGHGHGGHHGRRYSYEGYGHREHHAERVYRERDEHVCRYERRPVTKSYYNDYGERCYYTDYVTVRVCESYHSGRHYGHD